MEGKYTINITGHGIVENENSRRLREELTRILERDRHELLGEIGTTTLVGYTRARCFDSNCAQSIYYAHPSYRGSAWYDWAYVHHQRLSYGS